MSGGETCIGIRMEHLWGRQPARCQVKHSGPSDPALLAAAANTWIPTPPILCLRFAAYLTIGLAQDSRPSGSLVLTLKALSSSSRVEDWRDAQMSCGLVSSPRLI